MPLQVQLLPTSVGDRSQLQPLTTFLLNGSIAIDAGSLGLGLLPEQIGGIHHVIITHSHLDHVASLPIAMASGYIHLRQTLKVYGTDITLKAVRDHLFNGVLWPDFSRFPLMNSPEMSLSFTAIRERQAFELEGLRFTPIPVRHEVPTIGLIVESADATVVFTSDTTCTEEIWQAGRSKPNLKAVFIDCSFPNEMRDLAVDSGHLTPALVAEEVKKLGRPVKTWCIHIKPEVRDKVVGQVAALAAQGLEVLELGRVYEF